MSFWKHLYWRLTPPGLSPMTALGLLVAVLCAAGFVWHMESWNERNCDASVLQAETELADALKEIRAAGPLDTMQSLSCPVYSNFVQVAEKTMSRAGACDRPHYHDTSGADFRAYVAGIRRLVSERCPPTR